ncbi:unnamed protein product [Mytilus edulis]|uniref:Uncharacterized protein n=1 Tax=Mytilus edulis TaxID=6550 RepID=A0A8S3U0M5_MYTED|nr:unnamed protein product [Mytilus edulis]
MTEVTVHRTLCKDKEIYTASSPKSSVAGDARDKMAEPKSWRKTSSRSETENPQKSSSRFSKYAKGNESDSDENNNDHLKSLFGDDVETKKETSSGGLILDKSQIDILSGSWRCKNPERLTAYNDEYRHSFPVHEKTSDILEVPSLDNMVPDLLVKNAWE